MSWSKVSIFLVLLLISTFVFAQEPFWAQTNGPEGGSIQTLFVDLQNNVYMGSNNAGMYNFMRDEGRWNNLSNSSIFPGITRAIAVSVNGTIFFGNPNGIYRSNDLGVNWELINDGLDFTSVYSLLNLLENIIFVGVNGGVFRSDDEGDIWVGVNSGLPVTVIYSLDINSNDVLFAGTPESVFISDDMGENWIEANDGLPTGQVKSIDALQNGDVFIAMGRYVYISRNNGISWVKSDSGLVGNSVFDLSISNEGKIYLGTAGGVYISVDSAKSWERFDAPSLSGWILAIAVDSNGVVYAGSNSKGAIISNDGGKTWWENNNGLYSTVVHSIGVNQRGYVFAGTSSGLFRSTDKGDTWIPINDSLFDIVSTKHAGKIYRDIQKIYEITEYSADNLLNGKDIRSIVSNSSGDVFAATRGTIFQSKDNGETWDRLNIDVGIVTIAVNSIDQLFAGSIGSGVYRSVDNGVSWQQLTNGLHDTLWAKALAINDSDHIFLGTEENVWRRWSIFRSTDNGDSWVKVNNGLSRNTVTSIEVDHEGNLFAATLGSGVFRSFNNGDLWEESNSGLSDENIYTIISNSVGSIYIGTTTGHFVSSDKADSWSSLNSGYRGGKVNKLIIDKEDYLFAGTNGWGVYRSAMSVVSTNFKNDMDLPQSFDLLQNFPNPFNPMTNISFSFPVSGEVTLIIYNLLGEEVIRLVDGFQPAGIYETSWDASSMASGIYFYRLQAGDFVQTRKMVLLK